MSHTPGPWKVVESAFIMPSRRTLWSVEGPPCGDVMDLENEADARLIAAAPTAHDLLNKTRRYFNTQEAMGIALPGFVEEIDDYFDTLAKVEEIPNE